ncbi:putative TetR family transcriptional regulator [Gordonia effusa NBRC 100432]|uniref:Putative TetR family transcriptional regulator n=1 Tax=Gordonia effusa NBRC 100432 TaxID=1077974 RepID=H0R3Y4_9ACTN|nr:TetR family transcriptional regulator [Gordonia effusa]GAB19785.1 putative TetR family transcriptional regulator [Gordonia effusa NBRC 100432]
MPPDSAATKARLLQAAVEEFAAHGLAGARVDRIASAAGVNKRSIYVYFTNKETLFDKVVSQSVSQISLDVPFTAGDLPRYAGALFDYLVEHPEHLRLAAWSRLEWPTAKSDAVDGYRAKVDQMAANATGHSIAAELDPVDALALLLGMVTSWFYASPTLRALSADEPLSPERLRDHRSALMATVAVWAGPRPA